MEYLFSFILVVMLVCPLFFVYRRKVKGKTVKNPLVVQIFSFFAVGALLVGSGMFLTASAADTAETASVLGTAAGLGMIGAALSTGLSGIGGGIAVGAAASAALGAISENEKTFGKALIFVGLAEGIALYGMIISFQILGKF